MNELAAPEKENPSSEQELRNVYNSIVIEHDKAIGEEKVYLQGKKDGIRIAQILLVWDKRAASGLISTGQQERIPDAEYEIALALAHGRTRSEDG